MDAPESLQGDRLLLWGQQHGKQTVGRGFALKAQNNYFTSVRGDAGGLGVQVDAGLAALSRPQLAAKVTGGDVIAGVKAAVLTGETAAGGGRLHIYVPREQAGGTSQFNVARGKLGFMYNKNAPHLRSLGRSRGPFFEDAGQIVRRSFPGAFSVHNIVWLHKFI